MHGLAAQATHLGFAIPEQAQVEERAVEWTKNRNQKQKGVNWQLTTDAARIKLKSGVIVGVESLLVSRSLTVQGEVRADHSLTVVVPDDGPMGPAEVTLTFESEPTEKIRTFGDLLRSGFVGSLP